MAFSSFILFVIYLLFLIYVLVKEPSPFDLDVPVNFLLSRIRGVERRGKLIVEQDSSRRRREERGCLGQQLSDGWMGRGGFPLIGHHVLQT